MSVNKPQSPNNMLLTCPLLSANCEYSKMCVQDRCAWYLKSARTCAIAVLGHESIMNIKTMQDNAPKQATSEIK